MPARQDRVKIRQQRVKPARIRPVRVSDGDMTFESAALLALVIGLLAYLVAALIAPDTF